MWSLLTDYWLTELTLCVNLPTYAYLASLFKNSFKIRIERLQTQDRAISFVQCTFRNLSLESLTLCFLRNFEFFLLHNVFWKHKNESSTKWHLTVTFENWIGFSQKVFNYSFSNSALWKIVQKWKGALALVLTQQLHPILTCIVTPNSFDLFLPLLVHGAGSGSSRRNK